MAASGMTQEKVQRAAAAVFEQGSIVAASKALSIPERTLRRWAASKPFKTAFGEVKRAALESTVSKLSAAGTVAVDRLREIMTAEDTPPGVAVRAATAILGNLIALAQYADLEARINALEEQTHVESEKPH